MLLSKDAIADVAEVLHPQDFYRPAHQTIYEAIIDLFADGEPADPVTVADRLGTNLGRVGGAVYLVDLMQVVPTAASGSYYARIVEEQAGMRRLIEAGTRIVQLGYSGADGADAAEVRDRAQVEVYEATRRHTVSEVLPISVGLPDAFSYLETVQAYGGLGGVPTGYRDLDRLIHGLHPGELIIGAGRPGSGKTTAGLDFLRSCCITNELPGVLFSFEMSSTEVMLRLLSAETDVNLNTMRAGKLADHEWARLSARMAEIKDHPLFVDDSPNMTMMETRLKSSPL
jgi:replicative DNA helicase